ncbi:MAG: hypothetical protein ACPGES_12720 [Coraliomargarita sp.]
MKASTLVLTSACLGSLTIGYWLGQSNGNSTAESLAASNTEAPPKATQAVPSKADETSTAVDLDMIELTEALEVLDQLSPDQIRVQLMSAFALSEADPSRQRSIRSLLEQLAETHPLEALELASNITSLRASEEAKVSILETWSANDPIAALAWADTNLDGVPRQVRNSQISAIFRGYAQLNPAAAFQAALQLDDSNLQSANLKRRALSEVVETQIRNGELFMAKQTIEQLPDGGIKDDLLLEMVDEWARYDPQNAADYVLSLGEDAPSSLKNALISEWAESDPAAAAAWVSALPEGDPALGRATAEIIREWARYDLTASAEWLNSMPASPELDWAVASYTYRAAQEDPESAISWAESITNEHMRERMTEQVAANWKKQDPEAFQVYLDSSDLSDKRKEQLNSARVWSFGSAHPGSGKRR